MQLTARRAERELREEKERSLRLEREVEGWRLRTDKSSTLGSVAGSVVGYSSIRRSGTQGTAMSGYKAATVADATTEEIPPDIPKRKSSIGRARAPSYTKGFL